MQISFFQTGRYCARTGIFEPPQHFIVYIAYFVLAHACLLIAGCGGPGSAPSAVPTNFTVTPGENRVVLRFDAQPGLSYWAFYEPGSIVSIGDTNATVATNLGSPGIVAGLVNGTQYAFLVNGHNNQGKGGPPSAVLTATPRLLSPATPWTIGTPLTTRDLRSIAFGSNYYVAVGDGGTILTAAYDYTEPGGVTAWVQPATLPTTVANNLVCVLFDGVRFVALSTDGTIVRSDNTNLATWAIAGTTGSLQPMNAIAYGAGAYVAVGSGGTIERNTNAATGAWTEQTSGTTQNLYGVSYLNGVFVAVGDGGTLLTSADGITWTSHVTDIPGALRHSAYGLGTGATAATYVVVGDAGAVVSSTDAVNWTPQTLPTTQSLYSVVFGPDLQFIAVGTSGTLAYSLTGADGTWSTANAGSVDLYGLAPAGVFIAVGAAGANISGK